MLKCTVCGCSAANLKEYNFFLCIFPEVICFSCQLWSKSILLNHE